MTTETKDMTTTEAPTTIPVVEPRIYVASLADYNAGVLHGRWLKATQQSEQIHEEIQEMLAESTEPGAEDWAIHDYEGFGTVYINEYESIETVHQIANRIQLHGTLYAALLSHLGTSADFEQADTVMEEQYHGTFESLGEYAEHAYSECCEAELAALPSIVRWAIDWERIGQDLELSGDIFSVIDNHKLHVFVSQV